MSCVCVSEVIPRENLANVPEIGHRSLGLDPGWVGGWVEGYRRAEGCRGNEWVQDGGRMQREWRGGEFPCGEWLTRCPLRV